MALRPFGSQVAFYLHRRLALPSAEFEIVQSPQVSLWECTQTQYSGLSGDEK
ncbi:hypothetical protein [Mastigocladopsis repens]|uniref:hypothetical protein n=1 Tax=Mastigocladopsis repens TaxID=221287 RepID=UPI00030B0C15|nr:hypothetical protein [Mastigocladopsis repens]